MIYTAHASLVHANLVCSPPTPLPSEEGTTGKNDFYLEAKARIWP
jgi:hypothetical protein